MGTEHPQKKGTAPTQFLAHVYCGQTAGWIKMPLGTEVNLGSWSGALHLILHTFLHPISVFFLQHIPLPSQPFFAVASILYRLFLVS